MRYSDYPMSGGTRHNLELEPRVIYEGHCLTSSDAFHMALEKPPYVLYVENICSKLVSLTFSPQICFGFYKKKMTVSFVDLVSKILYFSFLREELFVNKDWEFLNETEIIECEPL